MIDLLPKSSERLSLLFLILTRCICHSANETLYRSDNYTTGFNTWYSDGKFSYNIDESGVLYKDCIESFVRSASGHLYSPVIDIHPRSDINILAEFYIKPCSDIAPENAQDVDKLRICSPLLGLSYVKLDSFDKLFLEISRPDFPSPFDPIKVNGVVPEASFTAIDNLASTNKESQGDGEMIYTTRTFDVKSLSGKVQFRIQDEGACFTLKRFVVYRKMCSSFTKQLQYFPKTFSSSGTVTSVPGKCVAHSKASRVSDLSTLHCQPTGDWLSHTVSSTCQCDAGYEAIHDASECSPCRSGYFKTAEGNAECESCPRNSRSLKPGSTICTCSDGFSRGDSDVSSPCTKPITQNVTNIRVLPFDEFVKLTWDPVVPEDRLEPVSYVVVCSPKSSSNANTKRVVNDTSSVVIAAKLFQPSEMYRCSVGASNRATSPASVLFQSIEFRTHSSILPVKLETRKVGIENSWYLHWEGPEEKKEIEAMVADFDQSGSTSYIIRGYYVVAQEKTGRHINHQESAFSANTTVDLEYMFPKFNNKFQNVSFDVFIVHQLDAVVINSSRTISVPSDNSNIDGGSGSGYRAEGGVGEEVLHWLDGMPLKYTGIAITATLLITLFLCLCILCTVLQFKKNKKDKQKFAMNAEMGISLQGPYGPASLSGRFTSQTYHPASGFMDLNAPNGVRPYTFRRNSENNYDDLDEFQRVTGAPTNFQQNDISKTQLSCKEQIGRGRFSNVFRARYTYQEQGGLQGSIMVAIKEPEKDALDSEMQREINIMAQLTHQNIVRLIGIVQPTNPRERQLIVMEYMEYGSLEQFLVEKKASSGSSLSHSGVPASPSPAFLLKILLDVAHAMKYLHENNFVHRDLAARNVLVGRNTSSSIYNQLHMTSEDEQPPVICKLSDFGLCRSVEHDSDLTYVFLHSKNPLVPIRWLAPEVADEKGATFAGDVWSFAVVTWEVFSFGKRPYWKWDSANIMAAVKDGYRLPAPLAIPAVVYDDLLTTCWRSDPTQRPSFDAIVDKIEEFLGTPEALSDLLRSSNFNPFHPEAKELVLNSENNVERWLKLLKMEQHLDKFRERDLSNLTQLTKVSYNQLKNDFGIQLVGNIRKLIQSIEVIRELQNDQSSSSANQESASINNNNTRQSLALIDQSLNNWCFSPNGVETFTGTTEI